MPSTDTPDWNSTEPLPAWDDTHPDISEVQASPYEKADLAAGPFGAREDYNITVPAALNPNNDFARATGGGLPGLTSKALGKVQEDVIEPVAHVLGNIPGNPLWGLERAIRLGTGYQPKAGESIIPPQALPLAAPEEQGVIPELSRLARSFTSEGNLLTLPFAGFKPVEGYYAAQAGMSVPQQLERVAQAKTPDEMASALTSLGVNVGMGALMARGLTRKGAPNAEAIRENQAERTAPGQEPQGGGADRGGNLQQAAPGAQPGQVAQGARGMAQEAQVPLNDEHQRLLDPHLEKYNGVFSTLPEGSFMQADHETGQIRIDPEQFRKWVDQDLKNLSPKQKSAAVRSAFEHEDIHLKTDPADAEPFWNSLSPFEQWVIKRQYLKGNPEQSPANMGFEAIRNRMEKAMGLTRHDFIGMGLRERWTARSLDLMSTMVDKMRRLRDKELSQHQKAILDKVKDNLQAARNVIAGGAQYTSGPFAQRRAEEEPAEGMTRLWRGHDGSTGGVYWSKDKGYASNFGPKLEFVDVPTQTLKDYSVRGEGNGTPNAYKLPPEMTKNSADVQSEVPVHNLDATADDLLQRKPGDVSVEELMNLPDDEVKKLFEGNQKRGVALQYDSVLAGMKLLPQDAEPLKQLRDQLHREGMQKLQENLSKGNETMPAEFGKVIWLNGAIEGALRKGPNYESVTTGRRGGPSALRKKGKAGEQPEMFPGMSATGVPGQEWTEGREGLPPGVTAGLPKKEPTTTAEKIGFDQPYKQLPFRPINPTEAKNAKTLGDVLTADARIEGSDLPVSATKRLTALFDKQTGQVHLVSTYRGDATARMVDPAQAGSARPNKPIADLLHRYTPVYSILLKEPVQNFHEAFDSMADFRDKLGNEASAMQRERGTGTPGIPMTSLETAETPFQFKKETEPNFARPTGEELRQFYDFFGDELPSDATMFGRKLENAAANASRGMINGLRKLVRIERAQNRGLSEGEALGRVLDRLYENAQNTQTRSEFVERTLAQSRIGSPEEVSPGGTPRQTGARELSTLRSRGPTEVAGAAPGTGAPLPEPGATPQPAELLSPEEQARLDEQLRREHPPRFVASPRTTLGRQLLERQVPEEPYTVAASRSIQEEPQVEEPTDEGEQGEIFPEREMMSEAPAEEVSPEGEELLTKAKREKAGRTKTESGMQKAVDKAESSKRQLDFWKKQGPSALRRAEDTVGKLKEFLERTRANISTAGNLSDQLYRLKTGEKADYDLALPVIKSALKIIPAEDRPALLKYADEMQVLKKSNIKLTDAQQMMYETFLKPLLDDNQKMYQDLMKAGVPVGESTYLGRIVQDTHSLYSRLWRGAKQRIVEGSVLGQGASFFKRRVFKALDDGKGGRRLVALVGTGKDTKVIGYENGKAELLGKMPPDSLETKPLSPRAQRTQRIVEARRLQELDALDKEEQALLREKERLMNQPVSAERDIRMKGVDDRLASINGDYAEVAQKYPDPLFETPHFWRDKAGRLWRFTDATVGEIEQHTDTRYYKEPMSGIITQHLKLKQIYRANQFLENLKNSPEFKRVSRSVNERNVPADWRTVNLQQFRGLRIEPRTADVLDLFDEEQRGPSIPLKWATQLNNFLRNSLFVWNPFVHEPNLLAHWFTARGIEWAKPQGYERMFQSGVQALNDVLTRSRFRDQALRAGAPLLRGMGDINKQVMRLLDRELNANPSMGHRLARALGYVNPLRAIRAFGDTLTWGTNEILTLQLIRETMARTGLPLEDAIHEVGKHMPNYRVPPRVLNSRLISHVMRNPLTSLWGHYHYGALRSYGEMGKEIFSPSSTSSQRLDGLGRVATVGFLMAVAYPAMDELINKVLGTKGLKIRRAGSTTAPANILDVMHGKKTPEAALQSIVTPAPVTSGAFELWFNRNLRSGMPIYERRLGMQTAKDIGSFAANKISPVEEGGRVFGGKKSFEEFGLGLAGITRTRADSAMSRFGRMADNWMRSNPDEDIREQYQRRTKDVFQESDYQLLRSAVIRGDDRSADMMVDKLLKTRKPEEVYRRIKQWRDSPFTGERKTDKALMEQMTPEDWDLWYQAAQERLDIANGMVNHLVDALAQKK